MIFFTIFLLQNVHKTFKIKPKSLNLSLSKSVSMLPFILECKSLFKVYYQILSFDSKNLSVNTAFSNTNLFLEIIQVNVFLEVKKEVVILFQMCVSRNSFFTTCGYIKKLRLDHFFPITTKFDATKISSLLY